MALASAQVAVSGLTDLLSGFVQSANVTDQTPVLIRNLGSTGGDVVYVGGPDVTSGNGMPLYGGESMPFLLLNSDTPYAVAGSGTVTVAVLIGRQ